ncbi:MAG: hypothetical protein ABJB04_03690 [Betaproteobacteria bacterium]
MKRLIACSLLVLGALVAAACNVGGGGSPPDVPTNVKVVPGDSGVTVSWDMQSGIEYWVFSAAAPSISTSNWTTLPQARVFRGATSPQIIAGLTNGTLYSFTVNGRQNSGAGGGGSPSISAVPRLSGQSWSVGSPLASASLNAETFLGLTIPGLFSTVGAGGTVFTSTDAVSWTPIASGTTADLNGITFGQGRYVAVGKGGAMIASVDAATWSALMSGTTSDLNAVATGTSGLVAVGANGTIVRSTDGGNWSVVTSGTTQNLYGVAFANGVFYAVGAQGTMLSSGDGNTWTAIASGTTADLRSFAWNGITFVAVGTAGTIITSTDGATWKVIAPVTANNLNSITAGSQFVIVGAGGTILTSVDAISWVVVPSGTSADLNAVLFGLTGFSAVGVGGVNLTSF